MRLACFLVVVLSGFLLACGSSGGGSEDVADTSGPDAVEVSPDVEEVSPDVKPDVCEAQCGGKECGDDGCGGQCGTCTAPATCDANGACVDECVALPSTWQAAGVVDTFATVDTDAAVEELCPDVSGDGLGDNALKAIAGLVNPEMAAVLADGLPAIAFEFVDLGDGADDSVFVNGFVGQLDLDSGVVLIDPASYDPGQCTPKVHLPATVDASGVLSAGPGDVPLIIPYEGLIIQATIQQARLTGHLVSTANGVTLSGGILAGVLAKAEVDAQLASLETQCGGAEPVSFCEYLPVLKDLLPTLLYDLDLDDDGENDAGSACMQFTLKPATIGGYLVPCEPQCNGRECGDDGCSGVCGACAAPESCDAAGQCVEDCADLPTAWAPAGAVDVFAAVAEAATVEAVCPDVSGDGVGDSALAALAGVVNPQIEAALADGSPSLLFELTDYESGADDSVALNGYLGELNLVSGDALLYPDSYDPGMCTPKVNLPATVDANGVVTAGPGDVAIVLPYEDLVLNVTVHDARITGQLASTAGGLALTDGVLAGVLTKADIDAQLANLAVACGVTEPPSFCEYLPMLTDLLPAVLYDLDLDDDGEYDAGSACMQFTLKPATITGYVPSL